MEEIKLEIYNKLKSIDRRRNDNVCAEICEEIFKILDKYKIQLQAYKDREIELQEDNKALRLLLKWMIECDFGLDNIMDDSIDEKEFEEQTENMNYTDSIIHYAKMYLKEQILNKEER